MLIMLAIIDLHTYKVQVGAFMYIKTYDCDKMTAAFDINYTFCLSSVCFELKKQLFDLGTFELDHFK